MYALSRPYLPLDKIIHLRRTPFRFFNWTIHNSSLDHLRTYGYAVCDNCLGLDICLSLQNELLTAAISKPQLLSSNSTILRSISGTEEKHVPKKGIAEFDLTFPKVSSALPILKDFATDPSLISLLQNRFFKESTQLSHQALKAQVNFGEGACFPIHFDTHRKIDNRILTAIIYLNDNFSGGELSLYPYPGPKVDIKPQIDRLVLFSSAFVAHRVQPSQTPRLCFTIWISASDSISLPPLPSKEESLFDYLMHPDNRHLIASLVYADEWEESILQSHLDTKDREALIASHRNNIKLIQSKFTSEELDLINKRIQEEGTPSLQWF